MTDLFSPSSIAVIGASSDEEKIGGLIVKYLQKHNYTGDLYPVNPNADSIQGLPSYADIGDVPETPDAALIVVPASIVVDMTHACLEQGVENVVIISSGFSETGSAEGDEAEAELASMAAEYDATIVGPNSQGFVNVPEHIAASFTPALKQDELRPGDVSFITQSGAFGGALTSMFWDAGLGLNKIVATGNEAATEALDFLESLVQDDGTEIAAGYIEGFKDGRKLIELKRTAAGIEWPIVVLKVGRSNRAKEAAKSHTGKLAGRHEVYESIFRETGVISVESTSLFLSTCSALSRLLSAQTTEMPGKRVGVVTTSGGAGVHIADVVSAEGLELPPLSDEIRQRVESLIPSYGSAINPIDSTAQVDVEERCGIVEELMDEDHIDTVLFQITNAAGDHAVEYAEELARITEGRETPVFVSWTGGFDKARAKQVFEDAHIPVFEDPSLVVKTIAAISDFTDSKERLRAAMDLPARVDSHASSASTPSKLTEVEAKELLQEFGVRTPEERLVTNREDAVDAAAELGFPLVAKLVAPDLDHRNRVDGIRDELTTSAEVESAYEELAAIASDLDLDLEGIVLQEYARGSTELGVGLLTDPVFGPLIMLGKGGTDIEEANDVTFRTVPLSPGQARGMLEDLETIDLEAISAANLDAVIDALTNISDLYIDNQWIEEGDVNPLIVGEDGVVAVDGLFIGD
jgi:acetyltransferase